MEDRVVGRRIAQLDDAGGRIDARPLRLLLQHDLDASLVGGGPRVLDRVAAVFGGRIDQRDARRLATFRILGDVVEQHVDHVRIGRPGEEVVLVGLGVDEIGREARRRHQDFVGLVVLRRDGAHEGRPVAGREDEVSAGRGLLEAGNAEIDLVFVVVELRLDRPAGDAAFGVDVGDRVLPAALLDEAGEGKGPGQRQRDRELDWLAVLRDRTGDRRGREDRACGEECRELEHLGFPPFLLS